MHQITFDTPIPSVSEAVDILTENNRGLGIPLDYDRMLEYQAYYTIRANLFREKIIKYTGAIKSYKDYKDEDFAAFLRKAGVKTGLIMTAGNKVSMSKESLEAAIATGLYSEELCKLMNMYSTLKSCETTISPFDKIFESHPICPIETYDNHRMILVKPMWVPQNTNRIGARDPGITNFARGIGDIFTVPKGWIKCEVDSGQIEPRIIQSWVLNDDLLKRCTMLYNDAYYGYVHYCNFLTDEERKYGVKELKPIEITDEMKEKRKKFKTFGNAVMYGSTENRVGDQDKANFIKYIGSHPQRIKMVAEIEDRIDRGQEIFYTAFGTPVNINAGKSGIDDLEYSEEQRHHRRVKRAINNPLQGTAADLMRYSVKKANNLLIRKAPNSRILQYVHDSGKFMIEESEYDGVIDEIKEMTSYQVEGWIPIYSDYEEGIHHSDLRRFVV